MYRQRRAGWARFGLVPTTALTTVMIAAQLAGLTHLDLPLLLGTTITEDPDKDAGRELSSTVIRGRPRQRAFALLGSTGARSKGMRPGATISGWPPRREPSGQSVIAHQRSGATSIARCDHPFV